MSQALVHLVNPLTDVFAGAERNALDLYDLLKDHCCVQLWSEPRPDPRIQGYPIRRIRPWRFDFPRGGTLVFVGIFFPIGRWISFSRPERLVLVYNTPSRDALHARARRFETMFPGKVEIVYASQLVKEVAGLPGTVEYSAMDIERFRPRVSASSARSAFTIGRLSRPVVPKHHPGDAAFYRRLAGQGYRVRLMGVPPDMQAELRDVPGVELLVQGAEDAATFLGSLDCLFFRTADDLLESWGRIVSEAMACGLPVVCGRRGGYAEIIEQGCNGFLFDDEEEAFRHLERLRHDPDLRERIGVAARRTIETLFSPSALQTTIDYYVGPRPDGSGAQRT